MSDSAAPPAPGRRLYDEPELYTEAFGDVCGDEVALFSALLGPARPGARVLSLGCGAGRIEGALAARGYRFLGIDSGVRMLGAARRADPEGWYVAARMEALPVSGGGFAGALAALLSFAYVVDARARSGLLAGLRQALAPHASLVIEVPVARNPRRLQGVAEKYATDAFAYSFRYLDVERTDEAGAVLHSEFSIEAGGVQASRRACLTVFTPAGLRGILERAGFGEPRYYPPYELALGTDVPPEETLRAVVAARRTGDAG